jgi:hypothetical protein
MLVRKPYDQRSAAFRAYEEVHNRHHSRWNYEDDGWWDEGHYVVPTKGHGIFGQCTHILGSGVRLSALYWQRYQDTMDQNWLRDRAYPMLKGLAEFYRNFPNFQKGADGLYHIHHVNNGESKPDWDTSDTIYEVNCLHMIFPMAIRASEILGVDPDLRADWQEINAHLMPLPNTDYKTMARVGFTAPGPGQIEPLGQDPDLKRRFLGIYRLGGFVDKGAGTGTPEIFRNRLRLREGPGAIDAEHLGGLTNTLHAALLRNDAALADDPVLEVFPAWPRDWDADFTLLAPGAFVVHASFHAGRIDFVELRSNAGSPCVLKNPWGAGEVSLTRDGQPGGRLKGATLDFTTQAGEKIRITPVSP